MKRESLFLDTEFTGLHQQSTLISLAIVSDGGRQFYAEFTDFDKNGITPWIEEHVMQNLILADQDAPYFQREDNLKWWVRGSKRYITQRLKEFLNQFGPVRFWMDCGAYDWVLFCELFGGSLHLPDNVTYMPGDLVTLMIMKNMDDEASREELFDKPKDFDQTLAQHNALRDAQILQFCYHKLTQQP